MVARAALRHDAAVEIALARAEARRAAHSAPQRHVTTLDHDVVLILADEHAVLGGVANLQSADDDVAGVHLDTGARSVAQIDGHARTGRDGDEMVAFGRP